MRVFIPVTHSGLRDLVGSGGLGPSPLVGYAVTGELRESYAQGDEEELEYAAMTAAARSSLMLLAQDQEGDEPPRRVVLAVDADDFTPNVEYGTAGVELAHAVPMRQVVALHVETAEAEADVAAAVAMLRSGGPRDVDEEFLLDACEGHELAWFATQEIGDLLA
jgi:predicted TIM-barrel enzyme